jgi:pyrroline-5-carboxylate reductase
MPLTAAEIGASPTVFYPDNPAARDIIARFGATIPLADETAFEIATVPAAIYGWAQQLMRGTVEWSTEKGADADVMRKLVSLTFVAAGRLIAEKPEPMQQLLDELVTPGGITELGLHILRDRQQPEAWAAACDAVLNRLNGSRDPKAS